MRWLRCMLSREFKIENTLMYWDYILGGIETKHKADPKSLGTEYLLTSGDPLINLDYLCVAMILTIKNELLESDFSMCLANLLNYPEPKVPESLLKYSVKIKEKLSQPNFR